MVPPFFRGSEASLWLGMLPCQTHILYIEAHVANSARQASAAANQTANNKAIKYDQFTMTHVFYPCVSIKTAGT